MSKSKKVVAASKNARAAKTAKKTKVTKPQVNLVKVTNQTRFLEMYLRGTSRVLSAAQARANYGINNLSARISELRAAGLQVYTDVNSSGNTVYKVSSRDVNGSRSAKFAN